MSALFEGMRENPIMRWVVAFSIVVPLMGVVIIGILWLGDSDVRDIRAKCTRQCDEVGGVLVEIHRDPIDWSPPVCVCAVNMEADPE